jgi:hypothetical protein
MPRPCYGSMVLRAWDGGQGSDLDNNAKRWRMVADVLNDAALAVELLSPVACLGPGPDDCNERAAFTALVVAVEIFRQARVPYSCVAMFRRAWVRHPCAARCVAA